MSMAKPQASRTYTASCSVVTVLARRVRASCFVDAKHLLRDEDGKSNSDGEDDDGKSDGGEDDDGNSDGSSGYQVDNGVAFHRSMAGL
uniref:Uncharacterized protein n=1 Tax=Tanacetum cinerariifolium TaxID=118510 RepID=A0A699U442_TANCI|nr:hypothetical protein [Tanacetum cinerariifolium]